MWEDHDSVFRLLFSSIVSVSKFLQCRHKYRNVGENLLPALTRIFQAKVPGNRYGWATTLLLPDNQQVDAVIGRFGKHRKLILFK